MDNQTPIQELNTWLETHDEFELLLLPDGNAGWEAVLSRRDNDHRNWSAPAAPTPEAAITGLAQVIAEEVAAGGLPE